RRSFRLRDKTLGVIGVGNVGRRVVRFAEALGMKVLQNDPPRERIEGHQPHSFVSLDDIRAEADIITLHVPLTHDGPDATRHLFAEKNLGGFTLINTARGAVVDNAALLEAIKRARLDGAVLDVWETEPEISSALLDVVDIATPHIAGYSFDGKVNG